MRTSIVALLLVHSTWLTNAQIDVCPLNKESIAVPNDCTSYYDCSSGTPLLAQCLQGTVFDCLGQQCTLQTWDICCMDDTVIDMSLRSTDYMAFAAYPCKTGISTQTYAAEYLFCINGVPYVRHCEDPDIYCYISQSCYDPDTEQCDAASLAILPPTMPTP